MQVQTEAEELKPRKKALTQRKLNRDCLLKFRNYMDSRNMRVPLSVQHIL